MIAASVATERTAEIVLAGILGLIVGSFLNVVIYRSPRGLSVSHPRSFCPRCESPVRSGDNIPLVSWAILRGRCRQCGEPISVRYPLVEGTTGLLFAVVAALLGLDWAVPSFCVLGATLLCLVAVELDGLEPPEAVAQIGTGVAGVGLIAVGATGGHWARLVGAGLGVATAGIAVLVVSAIMARRSPPGATVGLTTLLPAATTVGWLGPLPLAAAAVAALATSVALGVARRNHRADRAGVAVVAASSVGAALVLAAIVRA